jgi:hypothetical protein
MDASRPGRRGVENASRPHPCAGGPPPPPSTGRNRPFPAGAPPPSQPVLCRPLPSRGSAPPPSQGCPFPADAPPSHHRAGALLPGRPPPSVACTSTGQVRPHAPSFSLSGIPVLSDSCSVHSCYSVATPRGNGAQKHSSRRKKWFR